MPPFDRTPRYLPGVNGRPEFIIGKEAIELERRSRGKYTSWLFPSNPLPVQVDSMRVMSIDGGAPLYKVTRNNRVRLPR